MAVKVEENIFAKLKVEEEIYQRSDVQIVRGLNFLMPQLLRRIELYYSSVFETGPRTRTGFIKHFYNISKPASDVETKATDLDTKDIRLIAEENRSFLPVWFLSKELKLWLKEKKVGKLLNEIGLARPKYGSVVIKVVKGEPRVANIHNLRMDPSTDSLKSSSFVHEHHIYSIAEFRIIAQKAGWEKVTETIDKLDKEKGNSVNVVERYEPLGNGRANLTIVSAIKEPKTDTKEIKLTGEILFGPEKVDFPYLENHRKKISGRWLGVGVIEEQFIPQVRLNEIANQVAQGAFWSTKHLWQTRSELISKNRLNNAEDGEVIHTPSEITPIALEERSLPFFRDEFTRWEAISKNISFAFDPIRGERAPAGTTLGEIQNATIQAGGFYDLQREEMGLFIKDLLFDIIIPQFASRNNKEHIFNFFDDPEDLEQFEKLLVESALKKAIDSSEVPPTSSELLAEKERLEQEVSQRRAKFVRIPEGFYKNLKFKIDIVITAESIDMSARLSNLSALLQIASTNPQVFLNPTTRNLILSIANLLGIDLKLPSPEETQEGIQQLQPGGSISLPKSQTTSTPTPSVKTI